MNTTLPAAPMSPLRQRLIEDMNMRRFSRATQRNYVGRFASFPGRPPDTAIADDVRWFQVEQCEAGTPAPIMNSLVAALRFFSHTLDRLDLGRKLFRAAHPRKSLTAVHVNCVPRKFAGDGIDCCRLAAPRNLAGEHEV